MTTWDHSSYDQFYDYYAKASQSEDAFQRFRSIRDCVLRIIEKEGSISYSLEVADIGCGAGTQSMVWAELGHHVHGLDVNEPLIELARKRAASIGYDIDFCIGAAVKLPWADASMDVCLVIELLEHVADWKTCLNEFTRVLRPGGILLLTTTNKLCPIQEEFNLPLYSWYPGMLKRYFEHLAMTTRPQITNYAKYPAVNWFSFYGLRIMLSTYGFQCLDRFDIMDLSRKSSLTKLIVTTLRAVPILRWLAHIATPGTTVLGIKVIARPE